MRITIRMYSVGFGDCFLVGLHDGAETGWILFDCGTITERKAHLTEVVDDILTTCRRSDGTVRINLVVATHRHKDHVWGFSDHRWADVVVDEVWMPWTEDPDDQRAAQIRDRQSRLALALAGSEAFDEPFDTAADAARRSTPRDLAHRAMALNALTNVDAMRTLHSGFSGQPRRRFLPAGEALCGLIVTPTLPGVKFHVLGPPRDEKAMKLMDPPEGAGYLRWPSRIPRRTAGPPFASRYHIDAKGYVPAIQGATFKPNDRVRVRKALAEPSGFLNAALDRAINNTSLVLMVEVAGQHLLFTGDAQWGSWKAMLDHPPCRALLEKTTVLKVGHHGSHNATPRALIEEIAPRPITALFSTKPVVQWPNIAREPLLAALRARNDRVARTDEEAEADAAGFEVKPGLYVEWELATP